MGFLLGVSRLVCVCVLVCMHTCVHAYVCVYTQYQFMQLFKTGLHRLFTYVIMDRVRLNWDILSCVFHCCLFSFHLSFSTWPWYRGDWILCTTDGKQMRWALISMWLYLHSTVHTRSTQPPTLRPLWLHCHSISQKKTKSWSESIKPEFYYI